MDERILNEMDIEQLKELREKILQQQLNNQEQDNSENKQQERNIVKTIGAGNVTGGLSMYPVYDDKKAGKLNVFLLAILSFFFETFFIILSIYIFTK